MTPRAVTFSGSTLFVAERPIELEHPVADAWALGEHIIVRFDVDAVLRPFGQFPNLICIDDQGNQLWTADLPSTTTGDAYMRVVSYDPIVVSSFSSFVCEIDADTGRVLSQEFFN